MTSSGLEQLFDRYWTLFSTYPAAPIAEHAFNKPLSRHRFDRAFVAERVAVEIEGGVWTNGRHTRGSGFVKDCVKYNRAVVLGWVVLRYTVDMLEADPTGIVAEVESVLRGRQS